MASARIGSPAWMNALKEHCFDYVDRLYADAGVTDGMSSEETNARISAEHRRRAKEAKKRENEAAFWRAVQRRRELP